MNRTQRTRARFDAATRDLDPPFAIIDLDAFDHNTADLARRARGTRVRVATKSVRCRELVARALQHPGFHGVMAYSLAEAVWLVDKGVSEDILIGYPSVGRHALRDLASSERYARTITLMVDSVEHLDLIDAVVGRRRPEIRVCIDVDSSLHMLGAHLGVRRSPLRTPADVTSLASAIHARPGFCLTGLMFYEAQIAGLPDSSAAVRAVKRRSARELAERRGAVVDAVREVAQVELVNGGGTGSIEITTADPVVTEVTAGSGLFGSTLFEQYRAFTPERAAYFALPVVRRPGSRVATLFGGGYVASGSADRSRLPQPALPGGLRLRRAEGVGEVQTPVEGRGARRLQVGDRVWMRYPKAGEMCERFDTLHLVRGEHIEHSTPTYRGEGRNFG